MIYYEYGGMKHNQKTKVHIINDDGKVLCGVKSHWMEFGQEIKKDGFTKGLEHLYHIAKESNCTCRKCFKKWKLLTNEPPHEDKK